MATPKVSAAPKRRGACVRPDRVPDRWPRCGSQLVRERGNEHQERREKEHREKHRETARAGIGRCGGRRS